MIYQKKFKNYKILTNSNNIKIHKIIMNTKMILKQIKMIFINKTSVIATITLLLHFLVIMINTNS